MTRAYAARDMLKSKIHRATVTQADLHYVGSITIDEALMEAADLVAGEKVDVVNINNGARLSTYVIAGPRHSGIMGINGAAARCASPGDLIIVISYASVPESLVREFEPRVVFVDGENRPLTSGTDPAAVPDGFGLSRGDLVDAPRG
jgi:aspartate 1-decarboxylase